MLCLQHFLKLVLHKLFCSALSYRKILARNWIFGFSLVEQCMALFLKKWVSFSVVCWVFSGKRLFSVFLRVLHNVIPVYLSELWPLLYPSLFLTFHLLQTHLMLEGKLIFHYQHLKPWNTWKGSWLILAAAEESLVAAWLWQVYNLTDPVPQLFRVSTSSLKLSVYVFFCSAVGESFNIG